MVNPKSGHTAANITLGVDGLRDGDVITSPSLTNLLEGLHGNGIIRLQDGARQQANRNEVMTNAPGHCVRASASTLTVHGGYAVLDGCLYAFAGGPGATVTLTLENTQNYVSSTALSSGEEVLYVIYLVGNSNAARSSSRVRVLGGTPTTTTTGVFPPVPDGFLTDPITGLAEANSQTIVLAVVRAIYKSSGGGNDNIDIVEVNDKRTFIHNTPHYFTPLTKSSTTANASSVVRGNGDGINTDVQLKNLEFGADEQGDFGTAIGGNRVDVSALWVSHQNWKASLADYSDPVAPSSSAPEYGLGVSGGYDTTTATYADAQTPTDVLYFSGQGNAKQSLTAGGAMTTVRVGSKGVDVSTITGTDANTQWPVTSYGDQVFITTNNKGATNHMTYEPIGEFPEGHMIWIKNAHGSHDNVRFDVNSPMAGPVNEVTEAGKTSQYVFDGHTWYRLSYS